MAGAAFSDSVLAVFVAGAAFGDSVQFSWQAQHLVILSLQFSWQVQHLVTLEWKKLSRACGEMLNRNVEINVMLWFSAQGLGENANRNVEVARKKIVLFFFQSELTL